MLRTPLTPITTIVRVFSCVGSRVCACVFSCALMSGCLYTSGRTVRDTGPRISENSVRAVELNKSTIDWVVTTFGEPSSRACTLDGAEILRYDCDVRTTEGSYFLMLAASSTNTIERTCWWFEARDGKITRAWSDKCCPICVDALTPPTAAQSATHGGVIGEHPLNEPVATTPTIRPETTPSAP